MGEKGSSGLSVKNAGQGNMKGKLSYAYSW